MIHNIGSRWIFIILCCDGGQENMNKKRPLRKNTYPLFFSQLFFWTMDVHNLAVKFLYFVMFIVLLYLSGVTTGWNVRKQHMNVLPSHVVMFPAVPVHQSLRELSHVLSLKHTRTSYHMWATKEKKPQLSGTLRSAFNGQVPHHFWESRLFPCTES